MIQSIEYDENIQHHTITMPSEYFMARGKLCFHLFFSAFLTFFTHQTCKSALKNDFNKALKVYFFFEI